MDGKTVYRKVYTGTTPTEPLGVISEFDAGYILIGDFDEEIIDFTGYIINTGNSKVPIKGFYVDKTDWLVVWHQASAIRMRTNPNGFLIDRPYVLVVTYVK